MDFLLIFLFNFFYVILAGNERGVRGSISNDLFHASLIYS